MPATQLSTFSFSNNMNRVFDGDPNIIESLENLSLSLGSKSVEGETHHYTFSFSEDKCVQTATALEVIWYNLNSPTPQAIHLVCKNETLLLEGDSNCFKMIMSLVHVFGKDIFSDTIEFFEYEIFKFNIIKEILDKSDSMPFI